MKYSVLLLYPDYMAETFGHDTFYAWVDSANAVQAVHDAQMQAVEHNEREDQDPGDYAPLLVTEGHNYGLNWSSDLPGGEAG